MPTRRWSDARPARGGDSPTAQRVAPGQQTARSRWRLSPAAAFPPDPEPKQANPYRLDEAGAASIQAGIEAARRRDRQLYCGCLAPCFAPSTAPVVVLFVFFQA